MSVAKLGENQPEAVLPALAKAFALPPVQRTFTSSENWNIYQSDVDASRVQENGGVLSFSIPPTSSGRVMDLSRSHIRLTYFVGYNSDASENMGCVGEDGDADLDSAAQMSSVGLKPLKYRSAPVVSRKGSGRSTSYTVTTTAMEPEPLDTPPVRAGETYRKIFTEWDQVGGVQLTSGVELNNTRRHFIKRDVPSLGGVRYFEILAALVGSEEQAGAQVPSIPTKEPQWDVLDEHTGIVVPSSYNVVADLDKDTRGFGIVSGAAAVSNASATPSQLVTMHVDPGRLGLIGLSLDRLGTADGNGDIEFIGVDSNWALAFQVDLVAPQAAGSTTGHTAHNAVSTLRENITVSNMYITSGIPGAAVGGGSAKHGGGGQMFVTVRLSAGGATQDAITTGAYLQFKLRKTAGAYLKLPRFKLVDDPHLDMTLKMVTADGDVDGMQNTLVTTGQCKGIHIGIGGEYMQVTRNGRIDAVTQTVTYRGLERGTLGSDAHAHAVGAAVAPAEEVDMSEFGSACYPVAGWTDHIFETCSMELNSVSVLESFPHYNIAKSVDTLINTCGTELRAKASETGWTPDKQRLLVQDGMVEPAAGEPGQLDDICRYKMSAEQMQRRAHFLEGSYQKSGNAVTVSDGPIKTLEFQPLTWRATELIPDSVQVNLRFTRSADKLLFCGPGAYAGSDGGMPKNFQGKYMGHPKYEVAGKVLNPMLKFIRAEAFIAVDVLSGISDSAMLKHLNAGNDIKINRHLVRQQIQKLVPGQQSFNYSNILPGPKPALVMLQIINDDFLLGQHNDDKKFGITSMGKPEVRNVGDPTFKDQRFQLVDLQITTGGSQYPFRRYQTEESALEARNGKTGKDLGLYQNATQLYEMYRQSCVNPKDPSLTFDEWAESPLYCFETSNAPDSGTIDPIITLTAVEVRATSNIPLGRPHSLLITTYTPDVISIDQGRRVVE